MKKLMLIALFSYSVVNAQIVTIPDANFKTVLLAETSINTNMDTEIQLSEASGYTGSIYANDKSIVDLTGIEAFVKIIGLSCSGNSLPTLNLSTNTSLTSIQCNNNQLTLLTLPTGNRLAYLSCSNNKLTQVDVSANSILSNLDCSSNRLTALNVSANSFLTNLICSHNQITSLNVSANTMMKYLSCDFNQLTSLNVANNPALLQMQCDSNFLTSLNVSANTVLNKLTCGKNQLTTLNVSANTKMWWLDCDSNQLTSLAVSTLHDLYFLNCNKNQITSLNVSGNLMLRNLLCDHNQLSSLNVKNGSNSLFQLFMATSNPPLTCIEVDAVAYSTSNWLQKDAIAQYSTSCATGIQEPGKENDMIRVYPNPSNGEITLSGWYETTIRDITGKSILHTPGAEKVDIRSIPAGMYFITLSNKEGKIVATQKLVKE